MRKIQGLEVALCAIALYTVGVIVIRYIEVTYSTPTDKLLSFASAQFPAALGLFLAVQFLSILTSMENAKFQIMHGSRVGKSSHIASAKGGASQKGTTSQMGVTSGNGGGESAIAATGVMSTHTRNASSKADSMVSKKVTGKAVSKA